MRIALGSDHGGYGLKQEVKKYLEEKGFEYQALGAGIVGVNLALGIVDTFLHTDFPGEEKHRRRVAAIEALEAETMK